MLTKVKILMVVLIVELLLTMGATTGMAEGEEETAPPPEAGTNGLLERVADILGIDQEDLIGAFKEAQQEMKEEAFINLLNQAVAEGLITQEQYLYMAETMKKLVMDAFPDSVKSEKVCEAIDMLQLPSKPLAEKVIAVTLR